MQSSKVTTFPRAGAKKRINEAISEVIEIMDTPDKFLLFMNDILESIHNSTIISSAPDVHFTIIETINLVVIPWFRDKDSERMVDGIYKLVDIAGPVGYAEMIGAVMNVVGQEMVEDSYGSIEDSFSVFNENINGLRALIVIGRCIYELYPEWLAMCEASRKTA